MENFKINMGKRMKEKRKALNLTQEEMAEQLNVSIKHYGSVERGLAGLSIENLIEVSSILGVSLDYLIKGEETDTTSIPNKLKDLYLNCPPEKRQYLIQLLEIACKL